MSIFHIFIFPSDDGNPDAFVLIPRQPVAFVLKLRKTVITVIVTVIAATSYIFSIYPGSQQMSRTLFRQFLGLPLRQHSDYLQQG